MIFEENTEFINQIIQEKLQTPCYVFNDSILLNKISEIKNFLKKCNALCFAIKANPFLIGSLDKNIERFEACSPGEYEICYKQGIDPAKIIISGVNKTRESMSRILTISEGKGIYTIESPLHYEILSSLAKEKQLKINVMIRLSSGNQFGVDKITLESILEKLKSDDFCNFIGIHYFSGTQKTIKKITKELLVLNDYVAELKTKFDLENVELEYGPGLSVAYFIDEDSKTSNTQLCQLNELLENLTSFSKIGIELGRFIASDCGFFVTKVIDVKISEESKYVIIDGGIHQLHYYGQMMGMKMPFILQNPQRIEEKEEKNIICGSLCTTNDVIVRDAELHNLQIGDILIFAKCGAYSMTESSALFLSRELPAIYNYGINKQLSCIRQMKDTYLLNTYD